MSNYWQNTIQIGQAMLITLRRGLATPVETGRALPFRGNPVLRTDDEGNALCTACGICVDACPTHCIHVERAEAAIRFEIDWKRCMYCTICAAVCPVEAIEPTSDITTQAVWKETDHRSQ